MPSLQTEVLFQGYVIPEHDDAPLPVPPPFDVPIPVYPPSPVPTPWRWLHDTITADAVRPPPPLLLLPAHTTRKALAGAQTRAPASALTTCRGEKSAAVSRIAMPPRLPLFSPEGQGSGWVAPGVLWLAPVPMLLPPLPPRVRNTAATVVGDDPVYLPVDDGHRMRRMYPVITLPVKNRADIPITVSVWEHFAEVHPALDFHRPASWGYRLLVPDEVSHTFPPSSVSTVTLAAADPNFLSKTMMAPVALHWRQPTQAEHALLFSALPRKKWLHDRTQPGMPTSAHATIMAAAVTSKEGNLAAARNGGRLAIGRASQHAQALWDDEVTLAGGLTSLHGGASEAMEHVLASSLAGAAGAVPLAVSDLALSRHPAYSQRLQAHSGASSTAKAAGGLHWAAPRDHRRLGGSGTPAPPGQGTSGGSTGKRRPASAGPARRQHVTHEEALDSQAAYYAERIAADAAKTRPAPPTRRPAVTRPASASPRRKARPASAKAARRKGRPTSATPRRKSRPISAKSRSKRAPVQFREPEAEVEEGGRAPPTRPLKPDDSDEAWQALFDAHYQKYPDVFSPIAQQEGGVGALPPFDGFGEAPSPSLKPPELRTPSGQSPRPAQALFTGASEPGY
ncbi:ureB [Symbiodinium sp. KB8]|nr:ureB [Symbiodinium sp. KB8]